MHFGVLGPIRVGHMGQDATLAGGLQRMLLAVLMARANTAVSQDVLADALWDAPASRAQANLHVAVHRLRRKLPVPDRLVSESGGYRLIVLPGELDAERFESLLEQGADLLPEDPVRAAERFRAAQRLFRGTPYDGVDTPVLRGEIDRLGERRQGGVERLFTAELAAGRHAEAVPELIEAVGSYPLNERLHVLLMAALHRSGRRGQALATYQSIRRLLVDELGQEPGPELRDLQMRVLSGEPDADREEVTAPAQLPADIRGFTGRDAQLNALDRLLEEPVATTVPTSVAVITGTGGVGKTALALRWSHGVREHFGDGHLYVDLHGFGPDPPVSAEEALGVFLRELGVRGAMIPTGEAARAARFRTLVSTRRMLIVLDNALSTEQVRPLLPGESRCVVLVTSRDSLVGLVARDGAQRILLDRMPRSDALELLETLVGPRVRAAPGASVALVERCARLPLAIRIAAELVNATPAARIDDLAAELTDQQAALDVLDAGGDQSTAVRAVFSWSYRRLAPEVARGFRMLGLHPGYDIDLDAAAALLGVDISTARATLRALLRAHHLDESDGRFSMHDLLRAYAVDIGTPVDDAAERAAALDRLIEHYVERAENPPSSAWRERERSNLVMIARCAARTGRLRASTRLATGLRGHLKSHGHHVEALVIYEAALDAATQRGDRVAEGTALRYLASTYRWIGRLDEGYDFMLRALDSFQRAGADHQVAVQLTNLGVTCTWLARYDEAIDYLMRAHGLCQTLGDSGRVTALGVRVYLGQMYLYQGEFERSLAYATEVLEVVEVVERRLWADAAAIAGLALERLGRYDEARRHLEGAWSLSQADRTPLLVYLSPLASAYWHLGRRDDAVEHAHWCLARTQRTNERTMEPDARFTLGELHRLDGAYEEALDQHRVALAVATSIGLPYQRARAELGIGDALDGLGERAAAEGHWRTAHQVWSDIGSAEARVALARLSR